MTGRRRWLRRPRWRFLARVLHACVGYARRWRTGAVEEPSPTWAPAHAATPAARLPERDRARHVERARRLEALADRALTDLAASGVSVVAAVVEREPMRARPEVWLHVVRRPHDPGRRGSGVTVE